MISFPLVNPAYILGQEKFSDKEQQGISELCEKSGEYAKAKGANDSSGMNAWKKSIWSTLESAAPCNTERHKRLWVAAMDKCNLPVDVRLELRRFLETKFLQKARATGMAPAPAPAPAAQAQFGPYTPAPMATMPTRPQVPAEAMRPSVPTPRAQATAMPTGVPRTATPAPRTTSPLDIFGTAMQTPTTPAATSTYAPPSAYPMAFMSGLPVHEKGRISMNPYGPKGQFALAPTPVTMASSHDARLGQIVPASLQPDAITAAAGVGAYLIGALLKEPFLMAGGVVIGGVGIAGIIKTLAS
jgi:hypothetical protein